MQKAKNCVVKHQMPFIRIHNETWYLIHQQKLELWWVLLLWICWLYTEEIFAITWRLLHFKQKGKRKIEEILGKISVSNPQALYFIMKFNLSISGKCRKQLNKTHFLELFTHTRSCNASCIGIKMVMISYRKQYKWCNQPLSTIL